MKVTNEKLFEMMVQLDVKMLKMDNRLMKVEEVMNKGRGAITLLAWLGGITAIVIGYFYKE
tara:strand:- start:228 stop:410 length:183 start_codon:yes stop_codon:yes gene_type:complete